MEIYHTLNRGVDKRRIFLDDEDRFRFIHNLFEFNNKDWVGTGSQLVFKRRSAPDSQYADIASRHIERKDYRRKLLVDIHIFSLILNHYHLMLTPRVQNGISIFMKKLNMGYAKYFNQKYKRTGTLFEGRYKWVLVKSQAHLIHLPFYIHANPLDLISTEWRERKIHNPEEAMRFLDNYRWSSFQDYIGIKNFPSVTNRGFLLSIFGGATDYKKEFYEWLKEMNIEIVKDAILE